MTTITISKLHKKDSSIIKDLYYDVEKETLTVSFKTGNNRYRYFNIDEDLFEEIISSPSVGGFLAMNVFTKHKSEIV